MSELMRIAAPLGLGIAGWLAASGIPAHAQQFAADLVYSTAGRTPRTTGKLNVANGKVRIETPDLPTGFFIVHGDVNAAYFVRPAQRTFMEAKQSSQLTQLLVPVDPDAPCRQWQAMAQIAGAAEDGAEWRCERIGRDTVDGRNTIKYRGISPRNQPYIGWIDQRLNFLVRLQAEDDTTVDLVNIQERPQPESLFEIPADYQKFDPQKLIDRIKQSDVWVEPTQ